MESTTTITIINTDDQQAQALDFLNTISHITSLSLDCVYDRWSFYTEDGILNKLEYKYGTIHVHDSRKGDYSKPIQEIYHQRWCGYKPISIRVTDLSAFVEQYKTSLLKSDENRAENKKVIEKLETLLGPHMSIAGGEWGWFVRSQNCI
jgi:hypothetical protein